jgi:hypothetical protein
MNDPPSMGLVWEWGHCAIYYAHDRGHKKLRYLPSKETTHKQHDSCSLTLLNRKGLKTKPACGFAYNIQIFQKAQQASYYYFVMLYPGQAYMLTISLSCQWTVVTSNTSQLKKHQKKKWRRQKRKFPCRIKEHYGTTLVWSIVCRLFPKSGVRSLTKFWILPMYGTLVNPAGTNSNCWSPPPNLYNSSHTSQSNCNHSAIDGSPWHKQSWSDLPQQRLAQKKKFTGD